MNENAKKQNLTKESYGPRIPDILFLARQAQPASDYPAEFILPGKTTAIPPEVKHIGPSYVGFANEFSYFMDYTGQSYGFIYEDDWRKSKDYTLADIITGYAMRPSAEIKPSRDELHRIYRAAGFSPQTFYADKTKGAFMDEEEMRETIRYALNTLGQPVILPAESLWWGSVVIGYKENGKTLVMYHFLPYFMDMENNAVPQTTEISGWYNENAVLTVVGRRGKTVLETEIYREGIRQVHTYLRANIHGEDSRYFNEWERFLLLTKDEMIEEVKRTRVSPGGDGKYRGPAEESDKIWEFICHSQDNVWCEMAERRFYVARFFYQMMEYFPAQKDEMKKTGDHFWYACEIMGNRDSGYGSEIGDPVNPEIFEKPEVRARMADCVRRFKAEDEKGLAMVEGLI